jgi:putative ABC transport system ATP-binding protein
VTVSTAIDPQDCVVRAIGVRKDFQTAAGIVQVLDGVDLTVGRGETVAILGESGSGKSTLLSLLAGLDLPTSGALEVDGVDLSSAPEADLAEFRKRTISIVFQHFHLMKSLTALENVALPLELRADGADSSSDAAAATDLEQRAERALDSVGLAHRHDHFPAQLSGGEAQRVALARAIVTEPVLLVADEPTGNLDEKTGADVMDLLFDLVERRSTTLLLVTHSRELAARCNRSLALGLAGAMTLDGLQGSIERTLAGRSRSFLGADVRITSNRPMTSAERARMDAIAAKTGRGGKTAELIHLYSMVSADGVSRLAEIRAIDEGFPPEGNLVLAAAGPVTDAAPSPAIRFASAVRNYRFKIQWFAIPAFPYAPHLWPHGST